MFPTYILPATSWRTQWPSLVCHMHVLSSQHSQHCIASCVPACALLYIVDFFKQKHPVHPSVSTILAQHWAHSFCQSFFNGLVSGSICHSGHPFIQHLIRERLNQVLGPQSHCQLGPDTPVGFDFILKQMEEKPRLTYISATPKTCLPNNKDFLTDTETSCGTDNLTVVFRLGRS